MPAPSPASDVARTPGDAGVINESLMFHAGVLLVYK